MPVDFAQKYKSHIVEKHGGVEPTTVQQLASCPECRLRLSDCLQERVSVQTTLTLADIGQARKVSSANRRPVSSL